MTPELALTELRGGLIVVLWVAGPLQLAALVVQGRCNDTGVTIAGDGAADLGVAGKDVLMEYGGQGLYEPLDLRIALCKLMTAGRVGDVEPKGRLRVATKFVNVAKRYYAEQGRQVDIIKLYGSMELAPLIGLADKIIDVVDTGNTLRASSIEP